jgi:hypothetical protein
VGGLAIPWEIGEAIADDTEAAGGSEMGVLVLASTVRSREVLAASSSMEAGLLKQHWIPWAASTCCNRLQAVLRVLEQTAQVNHRGSA